MHLSGYLLFCWSIVCLSFVSGQQKPRTITIDGGWSPWSTVATPCLRKNLKGILVPVTCGGGQRERKRSCTNPVPQVCSLSKSMCSLILAFLGPRVVITHLTRKVELCHAHPLGHSGLKSPRRQKSEMRSFKTPISLMVC